MKKTEFAFRRLAMVTSALFFVLAVVWMFFPEKALTAWGVIYSDAAGLVSRRAAAVYTGLSVMFWLARNSSASPVRSALSAGLITACLIIATTGIYDFISGNAHAAILFAVTIEVVLALSFMRFGLRKS